MSTQLISKNTYGYSAVIKLTKLQIKTMSAFAGSSFNRPKNKPKQIEKSIEQSEDAIEIESQENEEIKEKKLRSMSSRTKSKIKKKLIALSRLLNTLTFVTLTFCNQVEDKKAVKILKNFLDYAKKVYPNFQYLWVAEKQTKNKTFEDNIHFHLITNIQWDIKKFWYYWLKLQEKHGIIARDKTYKPSSAFDVRYIKVKQIDKLQGYLTKYVTKNKAEFDCQVWNCSKKVSELYTDFYTGFDFIKKMESLNGKELKTYSMDYCTIYTIPITEDTLKEYINLEIKNKETWCK